MSFIFCECASYLEEHLLLWTIPFQRFALHLDDTLALFVIVWVLVNFSPHFHKAGNAVAAQACVILPTCRFDFAGHLAPVVINWYDLNTLVTPVYPHFINLTQSLEFSLRGAEVLDGAVKESDDRPTGMAFNDCVVQAPELGGTSFFLSVDPASLFYIS